MLDIKYIRDNIEKVRHALTVKRVTLDLDRLISLDDDRRAMQQQLDDLRAKRNKTSDEIAAMTVQAERDAKIAAMRGERAHEKVLDEKLSQVESEWRALMLRVPNIPSEDTPIGPDETHNVEIMRWGEQPRFSFAPKDHIELGTALDLLDLERGTKVSGFRGYYLKNELALLHQAVIWHAFKKMHRKGFTVMFTPTMVKEMALIGSGHFPDGKDEIYEVEDSTAEGKEQKYLIGTSEPSLLAYYADEILDEQQLPVKLSGVSQCYRREVGGYGKDTRGMYRVHEFTKVEQVVICRDDIAHALSLFEEIKENALEILSELELPHRVIQICTGDMGAGKYKMYDIETWMPSRNAYGETHSNSLLTDWQPRRINLRYRTKEGEIRFPYAMNNTAIASPRILIAILENYQQADGSVTVPEALRPYIGIDAIKPKTGAPKPK